MCLFSFWYGEDYPYSSIYDIDPKASGNAVRDASFIAQPLTGWFRALLSGNATNNYIDPLTVNIINVNQQRLWAVIGFDPSIPTSAVGNRSQQAPFSLSQFLTSTSSKYSYNNATSSSGLLGTMATRYFPTLVPLPSGVLIPSFQPFPWYNITSGSADDLDDIISNALNTALAKIATLDKAGLLQQSNITARTELLLKISQSLLDVPYGGIYFRKIDHAAKKYAWNYNFGSDVRLTSSSNFPAAGARLLLQQTLLDNTVLRMSDPTKLGSASITHGFRLMPQVDNSAISIPFGGIIGNILYPFGVSFLLPIFAIVLVQEKEYRILIMMKMNGMKEFAYYMSHYVVFYILYAVSTIVFLISGTVGKLTLFTLTERPLLLLLFFLWGHNQISLSFFFSTLFNKSRLALVVVFLIVLCSVIISLVTSNLFDGTQAPYAYFIWPPFAFYRALNLLNQASYQSYLRVSKINVALFPRRTWSLR